MFTSTTTKRMASLALIGVLGASLTACSDDNGRIPAITNEVGGSTPLGLTEEEAILPSTLYADTATGAVEQFVHALNDDDRVGACGLMTPAMVEVVEYEVGGACVETAGRIPGQFYLTSALVGNHNDATTWEFVEVEGASTEGMTKVEILGTQGGAGPYGPIPAFLAAESDQGWQVEQITPVGTWGRKA